MKLSEIFFTWSRCIVFRIEVGTWKTLVIRSLNCGLWVFSNHLVYFEVSWFFWGFSHASVQASKGPVLSPSGICDPQGECSTKAWITKRFQHKVIYRLHKRALNCVCVTHLSVTRPCDELTVLLHEEQTKQWIRCETKTSASSLHILNIYRLWVNNLNFCCINIGVNNYNPTW